MRIRHLLAASVRGAWLALTLVATGPEARAQGTVVFVTPSQPIYYAAGVLDGTYDLDLNNDGVTDFVLGFDLTKAYLVPQGNNSVIVIRNQTDLGPTTDVAPVNLGGSISANASSLDPAFSWYDSRLDTAGFAALGGQASFDGQLVYVGYWSGLDAFAGLSFYYGGSRHFGWMEINNYVGVAAGQVLGWAYETRPDTPIIAGQVPEPGAVVLLLLGLAGVCCWRRNRRGN